MKEQIIAFLREEGLLGADKTEFVITYPGREVIMNDIIEKFAKYIESITIEQHRSENKTTLKQVQRISELLCTKNKLQAAHELGKLQNRLSEVKLREDELIPIFPEDDMDEIDYPRSKPKRTKKAEF